MTRRSPSGAAVLRSDTTDAITRAVLETLAEIGIGRLSMEAVAKRAGVGKSALYRRWSSKTAMVIAVLSDFSVELAATPDTGSLRDDIRETVEALRLWLDHPLFSRILPDLVAESGRNPELAELHTRMIGVPRRERAAEIFARARDRGEIAEGTDLELAMDLLAGPVYWRSAVRAQPVDAAYLDSVSDAIVAIVTSGSHRDDEIDARAR